MKFSAPDENHNWILEVNESEYGHLGQQALKAISYFSKGKPFISKQLGTVTWRMWGYKNLELAVEVVKDQLMMVES